MPTQHSKPESIEGRTELPTEVSGGSRIGRYAELTARIFPVTYSIVINEPDDTDNTDTVEL
jgi:hypothetical protein